MTDKADEPTRVVLIRPGDVLVISGFRGAFDTSVSDAFRALRVDAGIRSVRVFQDEVDLSKLTASHLRTLLADLEAEQQARPACCDLHNAHCEPPSELCCERCTEAQHPHHRDVSKCVLP